MMTHCRTVSAERFARLPQHLHYAGEPNAWVQMTRPGQRLHSFLEGPCFDANGDLWLADVPYGRIFRVDAAGDWTLEHSYDGEPHSLKRWNNKFALTDYKRGLLQFDSASKAFEVLADGFEGKPFKGLSDLAIAPNGDIWLTDSGRTSLTDPTGRVFRYRPEGGLELVLSNVPYPNGIALSPDGKFVYVAATRANAVWRLLAASPETPPMAGIFIQLSGGLGPDGLAVDQAGILAIAHAQAGRAFLCSAQGDTLVQVQVPEGSWVTGLAFDDRSSRLYVVEAEHGAVWRVDMRQLKSSFP